MQDSQPTKYAKHSDDTGSHIRVITTSGSLYLNLTTAIPA